MLSESPSPQKPRLAWLRSQGFGLLCGQLTVLLLAVGSVVMTVTSDTDSARIQLDDVRAFFAPARLTHGWLYALLLVMALYGVNTAWCTLDAVITRWRRGVRQLAAHGPAVIHLAFLLTMVAHAVGGLWGDSPKPVALTQSWTRLDPDVEARLVRVEPEFLPNGRPKQIWATLEVRGNEGQVVEEIVAYNQPLSWAWGSHLFLLAGIERGETSVQVRLDQEQVMLFQRRPVSAGGMKLELLQLYQGGHWGPTPFAGLQVTAPTGESQQLFLQPQGSQTLAGGKQLTFVEASDNPVLILRPRYAPGNPWALVACVVLVVGMAMMGKRWWRLAS